MPKKTKKQIDLTIIIVNFNSEYWLSKTLHSLSEQYLEHTKLKVETIVVDNGSSDNSLEVLQAEFPWVQVIPLAENVGFAAANNVALRQISSTFVMLVNSDVEFFAASNLDTLVTFAQKHPQVAAITPRVEFTTGEIDPACHRGEPTPWASFTYFAKLEKLFPHNPHTSQYHQGWKDLQTIHTVDACSGAALLVRTTVIDEIGLLDERFFMYAEDLDWCKRMRDAGYLVVYHPGVRVYHHKYKSGLKTASQKIAKQTKRHFYDTMLQYYDKHYRQSYPQLVRSVLKVFVVIKKGAV